MDLPKILLTGLFFLFFFVFLEFLDSWAWDSKNLEKNQINQKKTKKTILNGLTQDSSHRIVFFVFFVFFLVFLEFLDSWAWDSKNLEKNQINQKNQPKKTIWNRLTPDSSHRIVFFVSFWFSLTFWTYGKVEMKKGKNMKKQKMQKPNAPSVPFCFVNVYHRYRIL